MSLTAEKKREISVRFGKGENDTGSTEVQIARVYVDRCLALQVARELTPEDAAGAKYWTTELQFKVIDLGLQLHGGYGYMEEYEIARMWRDARVQRIYGGTTEIMKEIVGRGLGL